MDLEAKEIKTTPCSSQLCMASSRLLVAPASTVSRPTPVSAGSSWALGSRYCSFDHCSYSLRMINLLLLPIARALVVAGLTLRLTIPPEPVYFPIPSTVNTGNGFCFSGEIRLIHRFCFHLRYSSESALNN